MNNPPRIPLDQTQSYTKRFGWFRYYPNRTTVRSNAKRMAGYLWILLTLGLLRGVVELELR